MRDVIGEHEAVDQVKGSPGFAAMRTKAERVLAFQTPELVEDFQVGKEVEGVVLVRRVVESVPIGRREQRSFRARQTFLELGFVVNCIEA